MRSSTRATCSRSSTRCCAACARTVVPVSHAAASFGVSRPTWYQAQRAYEADGLPGLLPDRPGPRRPHKLSDEVVEALQAAKERTAGADRRRPGRAGAHALRYLGPSPQHRPRPRAGKKTMMKHNGRRAPRSRPGGAFRHTGMATSRCAVMPSSPAPATTATGSPWWRCAASRPGCMPSPNCPPRRPLCAQAASPGPLPTGVETSGDRHSDRHAQGPYGEGSRYERRPPEGGREPPEPRCLPVRASVHSAPGVRPWREHAAPVRAARAGRGAGLADREHHS